MNEDGSNSTNLSNDSKTSDIDPNWSPDGKHIAFTSNASIKIMNLDGDVVNKFAPETHLANDPSWSPDGEHIAFHTTIDGNFEIYKMSFTDNNLNRLTNDPLHDESCPEWSPIGDYLTFASHELLDAGFKLHLMRADGTNVSDPIENWGGTSSDCPQIDWSPDGEHLAVISRNLIVRELDYLDQYDIIAECAKGYPDWSPDGTKIVFTADECSNSFNNNEIYTINSDGTNLKKLTNNAFSDSNPIWSPDGKKIAFVSYRDGNSEIYVMDPDGSHQVNLTKNPAEDGWPVWKP